ncbi:exocyst complex component EXO70B1 [Euphorbia lathyris]|uniref:exocyst complex component EXO70B1 n=1 Tax=Euphorbia lathyris TaxID=212925 RepID=UPI00331440DE
MEENGEEKLIAVARHIAKTLGHNESMADDILQIFSNFDGRFSREKLSDKMVGAAGEDLRACASIAQTLESLERQISQYVAADHPIWSDSADSSAFLDSIDELNATIRYWTPMAAADKTISAYLIRADEFMQQAMFRLEEEFRLLMERGGESFQLTRPYGNGDATRNQWFDCDDDEEEDDDNQIPVAQPLTDYDVVIDALPAGTISDLHEIAKRMVAAGFANECARVYSSCRSEFIEESISRLGLQELSIEEVQKMQWQELEDEIEKWIKASNVALRILYPSERRLCDRVFFGFSSAADLSFMEVCRGSTIQILNFADAVAIGSRSPERLFKILDLFETLRDLMPEFESNFSDQYCIVMRNNALAIWKRLGEAIRGIFMELENLIRRDPAKAPVPYGGLHPITRYVMNYLRAACRSRETLEQVFEENVKIVLPLKDCSSLSDQIAWIMGLLESNLEMKSKIYGDSALSSVFMMNNGRYIAQKVKDSELGSLLGDDWVRKHSAKIKQFHMNYQRSSWNKVLDVLKVEKPLPMKEKIKLFNTYFEDIYKTQSQWIIFDEQHRKELRMSLAKLVIPAYGNFIERFMNSPEVGKHPHRCIKYSVKDIEAQINDFFQGAALSSGSRK